MSDIADSVVAQLRQPEMSAIGRPWRMAGLGMLHTPRVMSTPV
jgi:hypothetical protein